MAGCAAIGVAIERFAYRPLRDAPRIAPLISALGVSFFLAYSMQLLFGAQYRDYDLFDAPGQPALPDTGSRSAASGSRSSATSSSSRAFALMGVLWFLVNRTTTGKAMRATSFDREAAAMMGIDIDRVIVFTFVLGSALAGAAGVLFALRVPTQVSLGFILGLKGFTAAVIGGIGSIPGAMAGGLILGFAESYAAGYWPGSAGTRWTDLVIFVDPDRVHDLPAAGALRPAPTSRRSEAPMSDSTPTDPLGPEGDEIPPVTSPAIGQDEWVARHHDRRLPPQARASSRSGSARVPWWAWLTLFIGACCMLPVFSSSGYVRRIGFDTVLYMLLALGLNVVVGWGGLLDLGYVAFYGIGAYTYALLASDHYGIHLWSIVVIPIVVTIGAGAGFLLGLPSRRLSGDYLAIVTLFFLQLFQTLTVNGDQFFFGARQRHRRRERHPATSTRSTSSARRSPSSTAACSRSATTSSRSASSRSSSSRCGS